MEKKQEKQTREAGKRVLLVLSTTRDNPRTVDYAVEQASASGAKLVCLFVVDRDIPKAIFDRLTEMNFLGERPGRELSEAILNEYRERGKHRLELVSGKATAGKVDCELLIRGGDFLEVCLDEIEARKIDLVVLTRARRSNLGRLLFGSAVNELIKKAGCPVEVITEP
ncbi:MAG: universal stress protein [Gemmatimonadota bacterium]|nr:universal stress protein [Gemmatimonadota bacterium]